MLFKTLLPCLAGAALLLPALAEARPAYTVEPLRLHAGPSPDYPLVAVYPPGITFDVLGCLPGYEWCDILGPDGVRGWAWSGALNFAWSGPPMPVIQYGPSFGIPLIGFVIGDYWGRYYRDRPWYENRHNWRPPPVYAPPPPVRIAPPPPRHDPDGWRRDDRPPPPRERDWDWDRGHDRGREPERDWDRGRERGREPDRSGSPHPGNPGGWSPVAPPPGNTPPPAPRRPPEDPGNRFRPDRDHDQPRGNGPENRFGGRMEGGRSNDR